MIEAEHLTKDYGPNRAVDGVSFDIGRGDIVGLLGPNGSGKTTIMRMLTGFFAPTAGNCRVAGIDLRIAPIEARRHIGYLPERVALYPDMGVAGYLAFVAGLRELGPRTASAVEEALELCGLADMADRRIGKLSRGYSQRVGIAQAIIHRPEVLILDEPTVGLDPRQIVEIRNLIRGLAGRSTVLLSTHILPEVSMTCRRVLILDKGRLVAVDSAAGLAARTHGRGQVRVRVEAEAAEAIAVIEECAGVAAVSEEGGAVAGVVELLVTSAKGQNSAPVVASTLTARGWRLHEISPFLMSLEELFVEILKDAEGEGR